MTAVYMPCPTPSSQDCDYCSPVCLSIHADSAEESLRVMEPPATVALAGKSAGPGSTPNSDTGGFVVQKSSPLLIAGENAR